VLRVEGISVAINAVTILRRLSLSVETGTIIGLVGRNGAGKTTTIRSIMGLAKTSAGSIELDGQRLDGTSPHLRARLGIGYLPEDRRLVGALSIRDNLRHRRAESRITKSGFAVSTT
jgi:branched-chain amino acid transport system ATP-binding protein